MVRLLIYVLILTSSSLYAQTYPVPVAIFDTMVFEVRKGRACDSLQIHQANEIKATGAELMQTQKALKLSTDLNSSLKAETLELRKVIDHAEKESVLREKNAKRKAFKRGLSCGIGLGILALLL